MQHRSAKQKDPWRRSAGDLVICHCIYTWVGYASGYFACAAEDATDVSCQRTSEAGALRVTNSSSLSSPHAFGLSSVLAQLVGLDSGATARYHALTDEIGLVSRRIHLISVNGIAVGVWQSLS